MNEKEQDILKGNMKWFRFYVLLPRIVTIILAVLFGLGGLGACTEGLGYGIGVWLVGAGFCAVEYILLKISLSYKVLHIYYLKKLSDKNEDDVLEQ